MKRLIAFLVVVFLFLALLAGYAYKTDIDQPSHTEKPPVLFCNGKRKYTPVNL